MVGPYLVYFVSLLAALASIQEIRGVQYVVFNKASRTAGGEIFESELSKNAKEMMKLATKQIWSLFGQSDPSERVQVKKIRLYIDQTLQNSSTSQLNDEIGEIRISAEHIAKIDSTPERQSDFWDLIYYEMTHILQWNANGMIPEAIKDGIAAYIVLSVGNGRPIGGVKFGGGDDWDQSPYVTARFFQFCTDKFGSEFVRKLNKKMKDSYDENYFFELTGKDINVVWKEYKQKYGKL